MIRVLLTTILLVSATQVSAAELFQSSQGVWLRSLFSWERTTGLQVIRDGASIDAPIYADGAHTRFAPQELCGDVKYATIRARKSDSQALGHLCPRPGSLRFLFMADTQEDNEAHTKTAGFISNLIDSIGPLDFIINAGDIVDRSTEEQWQSYRAIASQYTRRLPVVPVIGNHEYFEDPDLMFYKKVYGNTDHQGWYVIDTDAAAVIVLNSSIDRMPTKDVAAQDAWLKKTLARLADSAKPVMVTYHHAAYSSGIANVIMPAPPRYIKEHWLPLFEQYGVNLVLNGHEHVYERLTRNNINYVVAGPAAGEMGYTKPWPSRYSDKMLRNTRTVSLLEVGIDGHITLSTYRPETGEVIDSQVY